MPAPQITIDALTTAPRDGAEGANGTFDILTRALKEHLHEEFEAGRVVGREYATLYLGSIQTTLNQAADFIFRTQQLNLDAQLKDQQLALGAVEIEKAQAQVLQIQAQNALLAQQKANAEIEATILAAQKLKLDAEIAQVSQQTANLVSQKAHTEAQTGLIGAQMQLASQQKLNAEYELVMMASQRDKIITEREVLIVQRDLISAQVTHTDQQRANLVSQKAQVERETENMLYQRDVIQQTYRKLIQDTEMVVQQTNVVIQDTKNKVKEGALLDVQILKVGSERDLIGKKIMTEQAQYSGDGVSTDSLIGRQKELYLAQTQGFTRDAEQKAVKILVDTWNVRRTTDEGTVADATNKLNDAVVGAAVAKLMQGIGVAV